MFDYPGEYIQKADGDQFAQARLDELQTQFEMANGNSNCRGIARRLPVQAHGSAAR